METKPPVKILFAVYRKVWYGNKFFAMCEEVVNMGEIVLLKNKDQVVGILLFKDFSYAISCENTN